MATIQICGVVSRCQTLRGQTHTEGPDPTRLDVVYGMSVGMGRLQFELVSDDPGNALLSSTSFSLLFRTKEEMSKLSDTVWRWTLG